MRIIGVDAGTVTGFCLGRAGKAPTFGIIRLPSKETPSKKFVILEGRLRHLIQLNEIEKVFIESPYIQHDRQKVDINRERLAWGFQAAAGMAAEKEGVPIVGVEAPKWREHFIGQGQAPKIVKGAPERRKWLKKAAMDKCHSLGWDPPNEDTAESAGIWSFGCAVSVAHSTDSHLPLFGELSL